MRIVLRLIAIAIAIAAAVDPALARRVRVPLTVEVLMPPASDPSFDRAVEVRRQIATTLGDRVVLDGHEEPQALIALGRAVLPPAASKPVFAMTLDQGPAVAIEKVSAAAAIPGQSSPVVATLHGTGLAGRATTIALLRDGTKVHAIEHQWKSDDEAFDAVLDFVAPGPGLHRVRVTASTGGLDRPRSADLAVAARERRLRVLAYEPRPSWPLTFVRRSLEAEPLFDVTATARTTSRSATTSAGAPASLAALQVDRYDAVLVGAPEALTTADIRALDAFVSKRGGALLLLPDRRLGENVRTGFDLPALEEVILERPLATTATGPRIKASELLLAPREGGGIEVLGAVRHGVDTRVVVGSLVRGAGRVIVSGALDTWRYRADPEVAFDSFWRGLIADAAAAAPPPVGVNVQPSVARPGDEVVVSVSLRPTEFDDAGESIALPAIEAKLVSGDGGEEQVIRLWPGATPGAFEGRIRAPRAGNYSASVRMQGASADAPLLIADDVVHASVGSWRAAAFAAASTAGARVGNVDELATRLDAVGPTEVEQRTRPMRSPWWIVPFAGLLCAEWALRRKRGQR